MIAKEPLWRAEGANVEGTNEQTSPFPVGTGLQLRSGFAIDVNKSISM